MQLRDATCDLRAYEMLGSRFHYEAKRNGEDLTGTSANSDDLRYDRVDSTECILLINTQY